MDSTASSSSPEASSIGSSKIMHNAEQEQYGRPALIVDGALRWITKDGTPGDTVSGDFYYNQFHDGTFRLFNKKLRHERTAEFSKSPSARYSHLREDTMVSQY